MIKRILSLTFAAVLCYSALSCTSMKSRHFVGQKKILAENELSQESVWKMGNDVYFVRRLDDSTLVVSSMDWDKKTQAYAVASYPLVVSELGKYTFLNIKDGDLYTILRLVGGADDAVVLLTIDKDKIEKDIETGQIEAHKDDHAFIVSGSKAALDRYIQTNIDTLFSLEAVGVAELISGELN